MQGLSRRSMGSTQSGFTLIEVMVVVAILAVIAAMVVPNIVGKDDQARVARVKSDLRSISAAVDMFKLEQYRYPSQDEGLTALVEKPDNAKNWPAGGYLRTVPVDPWDNPYIYIVPGSSGRPYEILSLGADGQEGGEEYAADISMDD